MIAVSEDDLRKAIVDNIVGSLLPCLYEIHDDDLRRIGEQIANGVIYDFSPHLHPPPLPPGRREVFSSLEECPPVAAIIPVEVER